MTFGLTETTTLATARVKRIETGSCTVNSIFLKNVITFYNEEEIDLKAIRMMGLSVKKTDSPIGFFGTGLKFAIATLLRNGHKVTLIRGNETFKFSVEEDTFRGEKIQTILMGGESLGITTDLGKNWEIWQAYRELMSNCIDEGGEVFTGKSPKPGGTQFVIEGRGIVQAHADRHQVFLSEETKVGSCDDLDIHYGDSAHGFYRGIRAIDLQTHSVFKYNVTRQMTLTEDRNIKSGYMFMYYIANSLASMTNKKLLKDIFLAPHGSFESRLDFKDIPVKPGPVFLEVCEELKGNMKCNPTAFAIWKKHAGVADVYEEAKLCKLNESELANALNLLEFMGYEITREDLTIVQDLGGSFYGLFRDGKIFIDKKVFDKGTRYLASTIFEEWMHKKHQYRDESREFQNFLLDKLMYFVERAKINE